MMTSSISSSGVYHVPSQSKRNNRRRRHKEHISNSVRCPSLKETTPPMNWRCCCGVIRACFAFADPFNSRNERRRIWLASEGGYTETNQSDWGADSGGKSRACLSPHGPELAALRSEYFSFYSVAPSPCAAIGVRYFGARKTGKPKNDLIRRNSDGGTGTGEGGGGGLLRLMYGPSAANWTAHRKSQYAVSVGQVRRARVPAGVAFSG